MFSFVLDSVLFVFFYLKRRHFVVYPAFTPLFWGVGGEVVVRPVRGVGGMRIQGLRVRSCVRLSRSFGQICTSGSIF